MMKIKTLFVLLLIFSASIMEAQQIELVKKPLDVPEFYQNDKKYSMGELVKIMRLNNEATYYMKKARTNYTFAQIFAFTGAGLAGYPIGTYIAGGEPKFALAIAGAGLIGISVPFLIMSNINSRKAVETYNEGIVKKETTAFIHSVNFVYTGNGFSLALQF